jgi:hypothetical protein
MFQPFNRYMFDEDLTTLDLTASDLTASDANHNSKAKVVAPLPLEKLHYINETLAEEALVDIELAYYDLAIEVETCSVLVRVQEEAPLVNLQIRSEIDNGQRE